jgi:hypothetical protein
MFREVMSLYSTTEEKPVNKMCVNKTGNVCENVALRRVRVTTDGVENNKY